MYRVWTALVAMSQHEAVRASFARRGQNLSDELLLDKCESAALVRVGYAYQPIRGGL